MTDDQMPELSAIRARADAATPGPWWFDEDDRVWRLHGVHAIIPPFMEGFPEQVVNHQILKAPKQGTPYAEYWPNEADAAFIVAARTDVPRLLAAVDRALKPHRPQRTANGIMVCPRCSQWAGQAVMAPCAEASDIRAALTGKAAAQGISGKAGDDDRD